jgi:two-component system nitrate/nitrite response regulator NarL
VLLVDDHPDVLRSLSRVLAPDFEVAAAVTDGREAIDASQHTSPDIVLMDITMPGLDGFQTAQELERRGIAAPVLFLTMHEAEEFVAKAFRSGGRGYVVKTRLHEDLHEAMTRVLAGQLVVPSVKSLFVVADGRSGHAAQFYANDQAFVEGTSELAHLALRSGDVVSVIARDSIRRSVAERLQRHGWSVGESGDYGRYQAFDSEEALSSILRDGRPDRDRVADVVSQLETRIASAEGPARRMTLVGEISVPLLMKGNARAAVEVERLWNDLTHSLPMLTVCCYPTTCFSDVGSSDLFADVCAEHWAVA